MREEGFGIEKEALENEKRDVNDHKAKLQFDLESKEGAFDLLMSQMLSELEYSNKVPKTQLRSLESRAEKKDKSLDFKLQREAQKEREIRHTAQQQEAMAKAL